MLRYPIVRAELDNILNDFVPQTFTYPTALDVHKVLEKIVEIQCMLGTSTDYGLSGEYLLRVAITPDTLFLVQAEIKAI